MIHRKALSATGVRRGWGCFGLALVLVFGTVCWSVARPHPPFLPRAEDFTLLWWANGPQRYHTMTSPPPEAVLCLQSGTLGVVLDAQAVRLRHAGRFSKPQDIESALRPDNAKLLKLPPVALELKVRVGEREFHCTGRGGLPKDDFFFPVRFVEYGRFFQRVAIEGLEFADAVGERLEAKGWLELAMWPDRVVLAFDLERTSAPTEAELELAAARQSARQALGTGRPVVLELFGPEHPQRPVIETDGALRLNQSEETGSAVVEWPRQKWRNAKGTYYPEEELDRLDRWRFTVRNDSEREATLPIQFVDEHPPAITGFTPMLCEADGTPTGIPVQISKNWHARPDKGVLRHQGPWFHGCTFVRVPARSQREFCFQMVYARYGGVPAASHAQLSLIGWGHNQFWDEAAIGSFGESICYEPGRVQRRCGMDDIRPLMTLPSDAAQPYGWAGNGGGGDFLVWFDEGGRYPGFRGTRCDYRAYGPCLTDVRYAEETLGGEIESRVRVAIARSDDYLRAFHHLRYDVRKPVKWQRLAFYQLGADYYNDTPARRVAIGDMGGLHEEWEPTRGKDVYDRRGVALAGEQPWVSIHGIEREAVGKGGAFASRGLIVRSWNAVLGSKPCRQPHVSFFANEWGRGNFRTAVELSPPPGLTALHRGDYVEAEVELVMFPTEARAYYGPNPVFRNVLESEADTWRLVQREAAGNALKVKPALGKVTRAYPLVITADAKGRAACEISGGLGYVPVTLSGLSDYRDFELLVDGRPLNQAVWGNDFWQTDYDPDRGEWQLTYNLLRDGQGPNRLELRRKRRTPQ